MKEVKIHHYLRDIRIKPLAVSHVAALKGHIKEALNDFVEEETVPWREVHERIKAECGDHFQTPGYHLQIYRARADLTQAQLAKKLGIKQHHISEMGHNKRSIGKVLAKKLAKILGCRYQKFL